MELDVEEIGPSLRHASARVTRTQRNGQGVQENEHQGAHLGALGGTEAPF